MVFHYEHMPVGLLCGMMAELGRACLAVTVCFYAVRHTRCTVSALLPRTWSDLVFSTTDEGHAKHCQLLQSLKLTKNQHALTFSTACC